MQISCLSYHFSPPSLQDCTHILIEIATPRKFSKEHNNSCRMSSSLSSSLFYNCCGSSAVVDHRRPGIPRFKLRSLQRRRMEAQVRMSEFIYSCHINQKILLLLKLYCFRRINNYMLCFIDCPIMGSKKSSQGTYF